MPPFSDHAQRRRSQRSGRQRGVFIYLPASELEAAGFDPRGEAPWYRVWGQRSGGVFVRLYRKG